MRAELGLPSVRGDDEKGGGMMGGFGGSMGGVGAGKGKRPISVKFEIPYFTTSGIQVRYLKIIEPKVSRSLFKGFEGDADSFVIASISVITVGTIYHTIRGYRCAVARCKLVALLDAMIEIPTRIRNMFKLPIACASLCPFSLSWLFMIIFQLDNINHSYRASNAAREVGTPEGSHLCFHGSFHEFVIQRADFCVRAVSLFIMLYSVNRKHTCWL
jgi:hypothetical protein